MRKNTVLISGASIAGPALAYWLHRHGFAVTVVERAPAIRPGGHAVDIRGVAKDVCARMGIMPAITRARVHEEGFAWVDATGGAPRRCPRRWPAARASSPSTRSCAATSPTSSTT
ncbi:hypothetical protein ACFQZ4_00875 [Catellatospora coxensis]